MGKLPDRPIERMHYFDHQFLRETDFTTEQNYHLTMRRLHNSFLHTPGIANGLNLTASTGASTVTVTAGIAIDGLGREIVLTRDKTDVDVSGQAKKTIYIVIAYDEQRTDATSETGVEGYRRWTENPLIEVLDDAPNDPNQQLILGQVQVDAEGKVAAPPDTGPATGRKVAGVVAGDLNASAATITGNMSVRGNITVSGTVDGRDVSVDGDKLDTHLRNINSGSITNPHRTTATDVGALPLAGGIVTGLIQARNNSSGQALIATSQPNATATPNAVNAALNAVSGVTGVLALFVRRAEVRNPTSHNADHALRVDGDVLINGGLQTTGQKSGYVVDSFINASGQRLHTGDLVRLKGTPVARFTGLNNKIPVVEVTLADQESDSRVIGIVDQEAPPAGDVPDRRVAPDDPTFIEDGGEVQVVTLGVYAHCKVDAGFAPIEVGDLLTSSTHAGFARKATDPKPGCIIGKALEPLETGTGYIAVFVNMQ